MMKAILCAGFGDRDVLTLGDAPRPTLQSGQIRIRVRASGINRADILQRQGRYPAPAGESDILGLEAAGDIVETAPGVKPWRPGDRVMALLGGGGYAEEACVDAGLVMPLPEPLTYVDGAAIPEAFITAHLNVFTLGGAVSTSAALIHAGASGVGTSAIQLLKSVGAHVFATVGSGDKAEAVARLGARAIQYRVEQFESIIATESNGRGVDIILDPIGASYLQRNFQSLAVDGRQIQIGLMGGRETTIDLGTVLSKRLRLIGSTLRSLPIDRKRAAVSAFREQFLGEFETGALRPILDQVFPAASVQDAHARMESNQNVGKIVLKWD